MADYSRRVPNGARAPLRSNAVRSPAMASRPRTDRGLAYTLEGAVGAAIVLAVVVIAAHSGAIATSVEESDDRDRQQLVHQQAHDALVVAAATADADENGADDRDLEGFVRAWDGDEFSSSELDDFVLGELLNEQFGDPSSDIEFRVAFGYDSPNGSLERETVYASDDETPGSSAVAASYQIATFENGSGSENRSEPENGSGNDTGAIVERSADSESVGTVVDVEVTVW